MGGKTAVINTDSRPSPECMSKISERVCKHDYHWHWGIILSILIPLIFGSFIFSYFFRASSDVAEEIKEYRNLKLEIVEHINTSNKEMLDKLEGMNEKIDKKIDNLNIKVDNIDKRVISVETKIGRIR